MTKNQNIDTQLKREQIKVDDLEKKLKEQSDSYQLQMSRTDVRNCNSKYFGTVHLLI